MNAKQGSSVRALLADYLRFAGARLWLVLPLMVFGALAEGLGILLLVPLATIAIGGASDAGPMAVIAGPLAAFAPDQRFLIVLALFVGAMAIRSGLVYARDVQLAGLQTGYEASLRLRSAATLAHRGWTYAARIGQAGMQSLLLSDVPRSSLAVSQAQQLMVGFVMLAVQLAIAAILSPALTALALAILIAGSLFFVRPTRRGVRSGIALVERSEESTGSGFRLHAALKSALAQGTVPQFLAEYRISLGKAKTVTARFMADLAAARSFAFLGSAFAAALLFFVGYRLLALPFPVLVTSLVLFARMAAPAIRLQQSAQNVAAYAASFAAIERRLGELQHPAAERQRPTPLDWQEMHLEGVRFEHQAGLGLSASLRLECGEWVGISGPSGAGKTTLIDLVAGLLAPQAGGILVDGRPLDDAILDRWRAGLAYVGQEGSVFDDSVRANLLADSAGAVEQELWDALELVGLAGRIRAFPAGLDERVGDRGSALSGGERQRLAIARALLRRPSLLLLDEATAALDVEGESELLGRLRRIERRPAAIVVAHRPTTLAHCDSVVTIQHGVLGDQAR